MEWIDSLFFEHSAIQAIVVLSLVTAAGLWLGKMHVWGISLGVTFVFFVGILAGHLGISLDADMLNYAESFGLVLFVYALGLQVGPGFFSSLRHGGVKLNLLSLGVIFIGTAMTVLLSYGLSIPLPDMVGVLCGATTNTPALGSSGKYLPARRIWKKKRRKTTTIRTSPHSSCIIRAFTIRPSRNWLYTAIRNSSSPACGETER